MKKIKKIKKIFLNKKKLKN